MKIGMEIFRFLMKDYSTAIPTHTRAESWAKDGIKHICDLQVISFLRHRRRNPIEFYQYLRISLKF